MNLLCWMLDVLACRERGITVCGTPTIGRSTTTIAIALILELFRHVAPDGSTTRRSASGHVEMLIELPEPGGLPDSRLAGVLRTVAAGALAVNPWRFFREAIRRRPTEEMRLPEATKDEKASDYRAGSAGKRLTRPPRRTRSHLTPLYVVK